MRIIFLESLGFEFVDKLYRLPIIQGQVLAKLIRPVWLGTGPRAAGEESLAEERQAWDKELCWVIASLTISVVLVWYQF